MIRLVAILFLHVITTYGLQAPRLVYPRLLEERAGDGKLLLHIHDTLRLNLEKTSVAAPNLYVHSHEGGRPVVDLLDGEEFNDNLYEDVENLATVSMLRRGNRVQVAGLVGPQHRIEPLMNSERSEAGLVAHVIHEISQPSGVDKAISIPERDMNALLQARNGGPTPDVPSNFNVEIFVITDTPHHGHFKNTSDLITYLCVTFNSVNLRFKRMTTPKVRLLLVGVEMSSDEPFRRGPDEYVHDVPTLGQLGVYAKNNTEKFQHADVLFYVTGRDVVTQHGNHLITAGQGMAYVAGVCTPFFVGLGEDSPGYYTGVRTIAHEVAHLLGAEHDGQAPTAYIEGHPGASQCPWNDGYLMSYVRNGPQQHQFSTCSLQQMQHVIKMRGEDCWAVKSKTRFNVARKFPGLVVSLSKTCKRIFAGKPNVTGEVILGDKNECKLRCLYKETAIVTRDNESYLQTKTTYQDDEALDYTSCGGEKVCIQGVCRERPKPRKTKHPKNHK